MKSIGQVDIPQKAFLAVLETGEEEGKKKGNARASRSDIWSTIDGIAAVSRGKRDYEFWKFSLSHAHLPQLDVPLGACVLLSFDQFLPKRRIRRRSSTTPTIPKVTIALNPGSGTARARNA
jgi:hypothetical protein